MARKKPKPKAPKPPKLTPNKLAFLEELRLLRGRAARWEREKGLRFTDFPQMPETVYKEDIARVKAIRYNNFTPQQIKQYQKEYRYAHGYTPPTEDDFYNGVEPPQPDEPDWDENWGEHTDEKYKTDSELDAWIEEKILEVTEPTFYNPNVPRELAEERKEELRNYMYDAKLRMGTRNFYEFLQDEEIFAQLNHATTEYVNESKGTDQTSFSVNSFLTILNLGRPLTREQAETAAFYNRVDFDYTGTKYE